MHFQQSSKANLSNYTIEQNSSTSNFIKQILSKFHNQNLDLTDIDQRIQLEQQLDVAHRHACQNHIVSGALLELFCQLKEETNLKKTYEQNIMKLELLAKLHESEMVKLREETIEITRNELSSIYEDKIKENKYMIGMLVQQLAELQERNEHLLIQLNDERTSRDKLVFQPLINTVSVKTQTDKPQNKSKRSQTDKPHLKSMECQANLKIKECL